MQDVDLFQLALALMPPWQVVESRFEGERKRLDLRIDVTAGSRFACPGCGRAGCGVHDVEKKTWRHLNFFQHEAYLEAYLQARVPRVRCPECGVRWLTVPWARPGSGFTVLFEAFVLTLVKHLPVNAVAALVGETDQRLWRIVHHYVEMARAQVDMTQVRQVGILNWFQSDLANGLLEGINSLIQAAKAKARGYRSDRNLIAMIYLIAGKLDIRLVF